MLPSLLLALTLPAAEPAKPDRFAAAPTLAAKIDDLTAKNWQANNVQPSPLSSDAEFLRRLTLDLAGRVPTYQEARAFADERSPDKRIKAIRRLMESPEYALNLGRVLEAMMQDKLAGDTEFLEYLRTVVAERKPWDSAFREMMLGPWDTKERKRAARFLALRQNSLDDLATDTARVFFGVNVSCAKCHDHPLVSDWTQDHYYGMASFFSRTYEAGKGKKGAEVSEKPAADLQYVSKKGERRTAKAMFLSGRTVEAPPADKTRREQLVSVALEEKEFFSKAIVNRLWAHFLGRGLVHPLDQMHSANPPSVPGLLEWLAADFVANGYDLDRVVARIVSSRVYGLSSVKPSADEAPAEKLFAQAQLKPLTPSQFAFSFLLAAGDGSYDDSKTSDARSKKYREMEGQAGGMLRLKLLDGGTDKYQASAGEALYLSNHADVQKSLAPSGKNLAARLVALTDSREIVDLAVWTTLGRAPEAEEREFLASWLTARKDTRTKACAEMVWALLASAEFRFNH
jgi:hypothetical protein